MLPRERPMIVLIMIISFWLLAASDHCWLVPLCFHSITRSASIKRCAGILSPQHLGGLEVDHQLELRRPFYREIRGLGSLEDLIDVNCGTPVHISQIGSITHQATELRKSFLIVDGR